MPLQADLAEFCVDLKVAPGSICITLPGGAQICAKADASVPDIAEQVKQAFDTVNSALTPLVPIFNIIDTVIAAVNCIGAIPDALLAVPPDPSKIADCLPDLAKKLDALLKLVPQVSVPLLLAEIIDNLILFLLGYKNQIKVMIARANAVAVAQTRATTLGNVQLQTILDCTTGNLQAELVNLNAGFTPIQRLIGLVNALADLAGLPCIPAISGVNDLTEEALVPIDEAIAFLRDLRALIPIPESGPGGSATFSAECED